MLFLKISICLLLSRPFNYVIAFTKIFKRRPLFRGKVDQQSALQTSRKEKNDRIPFTLTFHPHNHTVKSIILNNFKLLQNDPETGRICSQPPLISFKRGKNVGNFLVRSALKTNEQPGTFKCAFTIQNLSFHASTLAKYRDLGDLLRSPIVLHVPPQMSFIV